MDDYIDLQPAPLRRILERVRHTIRDAVPEAEELRTKCRPTNFTVARCSISPAIKAPSPDSLADSNDESFQGLGCEFQCERPECKLMKGAVRLK